MKSIYSNLAFVIFSLSLTAPALGQSSDNQLSFNIFAAELGEQNSEGCQPHGDQCLMFLGDGPIASDVEFSYKVIDDVSLELTLDSDVVDAINKASKNYKEKRLAMVYNGKVFFAPPLIKEQIKGNKVVLSFATERDFKEVNQVLKSAS